jgi:hypothetical protein
MCELAHTQIGFLWNAGGRHSVLVELGGLIAVAVHEGRSYPFRGEGGKVRNRRVSPVAPRLREGPLAETTAGVRPRPQERLLMPPDRTLPGRTSNDDIG